MGGLAERAEQVNKPREGLVVVVMGSETDKDYADKIVEVLDRFDIKHAIRVGSAHKTPIHLL